jgi:predicted TIM-barrel fold metal-dependent hydrolase
LLPSLCNLCYGSFPIKQHLDCLHSLFGFANDNHLPVSIHTGEDDFEKPNFFEPFFAEYEKANIILAHCRPLTDTLEIFKKYARVKGDIAFVSKENIQSIIDNGYKERLVTGTDFPVTHYFSTAYKNSNKSLKEQYQEDISVFTAIIAPIPNLPPLMSFNIGIKLKALLSNPESRYNNP